MFPFIHLLSVKSSKSNMTTTFKPIDSCACCTGMPTEFHESLAEIAFKASICGLASKGCLVEEMQEAMRHRVDRLSRDIRSVATQPHTDSEDTNIIDWDVLCSAHELVLQREARGDDAPDTMTVAGGFRLLFLAMSAQRVPKSRQVWVELVGKEPLGAGRDRAAAFFLYSVVMFIDANGGSCCTPEAMLEWLVVYSCANQYSPTGTPPVLYAVRHVRPSTLNILLDGFYGNPFLHSAGLNDTALHRVSTEGYDNTCEALLASIIRCGAWWEEVAPAGGGGGCGRRLVSGFMESPNAQGRTAMAHLRNTMNQREITPDISRYQGYTRIEKLVSDTLSHPLSSRK